VGNGPVRTERDGKLTITDGDSNTIELTFDNELNFVPAHYDEVENFDRGAADPEVRDGQAVRGTLSFKIGPKAILVADTGGSEDISVYEALSQSGGAAAWVTTGPAGEKYAVTLAYEVANPDSDGKKETITFTKFRMSGRHDELRGQVRVAVVGARRAVVRRRPWRGPSRARPQPIVTKGGRGGEAKPRPAGADYEVGRWRCFSA